MIGKVLADRYEILEEIGRGGMAYVYKAKCKLLNRIVAIKVLRNDLDESEDFLKRFNAEAQAAASLVNPNIVSVYDVGSEGDIHYIVMEYVEGVTLKDYISIKKVLSWQEAVRFAMEICSGLSAAHSHGIVHRDIKPHNIIVTEDGQVKVTDFGIARMVSSSTLSANESVLGSVHYFSPEQARGRYVDHKTDIYSLGIVLYEMLSGHVPYDGDTNVEVAMKHIEANPKSLCEINPDIPKAVEMITFKAMKKETVSRYQSVDTMREDLKAVLRNPDKLPETDNISDDISEGYTKKINVIDDVDTEVLVDTPKEDSDIKKKKISSMDKKTKIIALVSAVLIVAVIAVIGVLSFNMFGSGLKEELEVPYILGLSVDEAKSVAKDAGFTIEVEEELVYSDVFADGTIAEQEPQGNSVTKESDIIKVKLSGVPVEEVILGDYKGGNSISVEKELKKLGFEVEIVEEESEDMEEGKVIRQEPKANTKLMNDSKVTLYVSSGDPKPKVPDVEELTLNRARRELEEVGLKLGNVKYIFDDNVEKGIVIFQHTAADEKVNEGSEIDLDVSVGKKLNNSVLVNIDQYSGNIDRVTIILEAQTDAHEPMNIGENSTLRDVTGGSVGVPVRGTGKVNYKVYVDSDTMEKTFVENVTVNFR